MILAAHQPDLFPYPGFFKKLAACDVFDVAIHDQFQSRGYQRRVKMRGQWASLPVDGATTSGPISEVRITDGGVRALRDLIVGRYRSAVYFRERWPEVDRMIEKAPKVWLWEFNLSLIHGVAGLLGVRTDHLSFSPPPVGRGVDGLLSVCRAYPEATVYLSGTGGRAYMGEEPEARFAAAGVELRWNEWESPTSDSILTLIFDERDPGRWFE